MRRETARIGEQRCGRPSGKVEAPDTGAIDGQVDQTVVNHLAHRDATQPARFGVDERQRCLVQLENIATDDIGHVDIAARNAEHCP